jgi:hypothetical protein
MIREKDIKAALIDWLFDKGQTEDAVIINEMVVANWSRRADIAIANGRLYAFEIKSSFDNLKRLPGQVDLFSSYFDKVTVVAASKFVPKILETYPTEIGVLEVIDQSGSAKIRQARAGRLNETRDPLVLSDFLTKAELSKLLRSEGIAAPPNSTRRALVELIYRLPSSSIKKYVLSKIKEKYSETSTSFSIARKTAGTLDSIHLLSRKEIAIRAAQKLADQHTGTSFVPNPNARSLNLGGLSLATEEIADLPSAVICRRKRS